MLRRHQQCFEEIISGIITGSTVRDILCHVCPGGGKSTIPIQAGRLIPAGLADAICWVCPRLSLQDQAERNFLDPFFRDLFRHSLVIRSSCNDVNPLRGTNGVTTTYQALMVDKHETLLQDFKRRRYILVLDEFHHAEANDGAWTKPLQALYDHAAYRVLLTGTLMRGDGRRIAFTKYRQEGTEFVPYLESDEETAVIEYGRKAALEDKAILPVEFIFSDGEAQWEKKSGKVITAQLSTKNEKEYRHALYTALNTEYAREFLWSAVQHWQNYRLSKPTAKLLIVAARIKTAKEYTSFLKSKGLNARIAASDDSKDAQRAIKAFKSGKVDILVSIGLCYEGLDVPAISHIACLTQIRSLPWITQMVARAVRIDPHAGPYESQRGYIFAPNDILFREISQKIESEQILPATIHPKEEKTVNGNGQGGEAQPPGGIKPLSSRLMTDFELVCQDMRRPALPVYEEIKTSKETESDLLAVIDRHIREYAFNNRFNPHKLNAELYDYFKKPRRHMTVPELEKVLGHVRAVYPLSVVRGTGHKRVPTKAVRIEASQWRP